MMLLVTDGHDTSNVSSAYTAAAAKGIDIFVIGVGDGNDVTTVECYNSLQ